MKESVSYPYLLNMMLVFIVISFCVIIATISYTKAYRINSKIANALEIAEGYNNLSKVEIERLISSFGYQQTDVNCKTRDFMVSVKKADGSIQRKNVSVEPLDDFKSNAPGYCLYEVDDGNYIYYGVTTYMLFDFPVMNLLKLPVYNNTEKIYKFE